MPAAKVRRERKLPIQQLSILGTRGPLIEESTTNLIVSSNMSLRRTDCQHVYLSLPSGNGEVFQRTRE